MITSKIARDLSETLNYSQFLSAISSKIISTANEGCYMLTVWCPERFLNQFKEDLNQNDYKSIIENNRIHILW